MEWITEWTAALPALVCVAQALLVLWLGSKMKELARMRDERDDHVRSLLERYRAKEHEALRLALYCRTLSRQAAWLANAAHILQGCCERDYCPDCQWHDANRPICPKNDCKSPADWREAARKAVEENNARELQGLSLVWQAENMASISPDRCGEAGACGENGGGQGGNVAP